MGDPILIADALVKRFPQGRGDVEILHGISLSLKAGEIVAVLGPSGAGKSTLLHLLGLMEPPSSGGLRIGGQDTRELSAAHRATLRNNVIGFLFQFHHLLPELSLIENVTLPRRIQGMTMEEAQTQASQLLGRIGLQGQAHQRPATLSGGEQQRASLARALINEPSLILADEPTGNLDKENGEIVLKLLWDETRRRGAAAVIVTHQEDIARRADRWIRLRDGRVEAESSS